MIKRGFLTTLFICILLVVGATSALADTQHTVQPGETLYRISRHYGVSVETIAHRNHIVNPNQIYVGQLLIIPDGSTPPPAVTPAPEVITHIVARGETLNWIAQWYGVPADCIITYNGITNPNWIYPGQVLHIPTEHMVNAPTPMPAPMNTPTPMLQPTTIAPTPYPTGPWPTAIPEGGTPPVPTPVPPTAVPTNVPPTAVPPTAVPTTAPTQNASFGLGGQTQSFAHPQEMLDMGMTWVKFQHKWNAGDSAEILRARIDDAKAKGFKVLLSIPGARNDVIDFNEYTDFLAGVSGLGPDAIEVWNEQNIDREWPTGQINAASYVNDMLKPAYEKIKGTNPNVLVISGAPAPTGFFGGGCTAQGCDDKPYVADMFANGAEQYMDCLGIHYNEGILSPWLREGDPRGNPNHYTRYYPTMVEAYREASNNSKPLCFTELGYLSAEDFGGLPATSPFAWANDTSLTEHADWLGQAVQIAKDDPNIPMLILFNVDFSSFDANGDPQAAYSLLRPDSSCPACNNITNVMLP